MSDQMDKIQETTKVTGKKKRIGLIITLILLVVLITGLVFAGMWYNRKVEFYRTHFQPGTTVNDIICDDMEASQVAEILESREVYYELVVTGRDGQKIGTLTAEDIGKKYVNTIDDVQSVLESQDEVRWILAWLGKVSHSYDVTCELTYDKQQTKEKVESWVTLDEKKMEQPQDAYLSEYITEKKGYEIIPETKGNAFDAEKAMQLILAAVENEDAALDIEKEGCYFEAEITAQDEELNGRCEELNRLTGTCITYDWNGETVILDGDTIYQWILPIEESAAADAEGAGDGQADASGDNKAGTEADAGKNGEAAGTEADKTGESAGTDTKTFDYKYYTIDESAVAKFVKEHAKKNDTYGVHRQFTTALGKTIKVLNGGYGWGTDKEEETAELLTLIKEGAVTEREPIYWVTAKKKGKEDIGNSYVEIDLSNQHLYLYWKGELVLETDFVSGDMSNGNYTPAGLYRLTYKTTDAVLRGRDYATPVKYWMPFNRNVGMHDATWRSEFGGSIFLTDGSHGCINLPFDKAEAIYGYVSTGFPIICYYY